MKKLLSIFVGVLLAVSAYATMDAVPFSYEDTSVSGLSDTGKLVELSFLEGVLVQFSNEVALAVSGTGLKPNSSGNYKLDGTFDSSNRYESLDGTYIIAFTNDTWSIFDATGGLDTGPAWTNDDPTVMIGTGYYPHALATGLVTVAAITPSFRVSISAMEDNTKAGRIVFSNNTITAEGYYPLRVQANTATVTATNEVVRMPFANEYPVLVTKAGASNLHTRIKLIFNDR